MDFVPFDATEEEVAEYAVLRDGVPASMRPDLSTWIWKALKNNHDFVYPEQIHTLANVLDADFKLSSTYTGILRETEIRKLLNNLSERELLRVADRLLFQQPGHKRHLNQGLELILGNGRSKWTVAEKDGCDRLSARVEPGVQAAAEAVMGGESASSTLLRRAWTKIHDLEPDAPSAYASAVKAVEAAAFAALGITDELATLSTATREIEKSGATWGLPFLREHTQHPSKEVLIGMMKSLYKGHRDRHGSEAYSDVTHDEAEAAVLMAVALVGWFASGLVQERDTETFG